MHPLKKISSDPKSIKKIGRYKNKGGYSLHGIFQRSYKKTQDILFISNGHLLAKYKYPKIESTFESPMLNAFNLHLCGGWFWPNVNNDEEILNRVIKGLKPMGDIVDKKHNIKKILQIAEKEGLTCLISPHSWENYENIKFCRDSRFDELFNVEALFSDYCKYFLSIFRKTDGEYQKFRAKITNHRLSDFLDFDISTPRIDSDIIITGLILGYPVWSTISVMWMG